MTDPSEDCPVRVGDLLAGKYLVERVLGVGGMGVVLQAKHLELEHTVALKLMLREMLSNPEAVGRFMREARAAARLQSEHIVRVLDVSRLDSGVPFMVMEMLRGRDLAEVLALEGPQPVQTCVDRLLQACEALAEAHAAGIIHRDLKPANLFLADRPDGTQCIKVLDFGISKVQSSVDAGITSTQSVLGSPAYMSPEQLRSAKNVDAATDIWALGVILFELLTGRRAYDGDTLAELVAKISVDPAPDLRPLRPDVPDELEALVLRCLQKDPRSRPKSVAELANGLEPFASQAAAGTTIRIRKLLGLSSHAGGTAPMPDSSSEDASLGTDDTLHAPNTSATFGVTADPPRPARARWVLPAVFGIAGSGVLGLLGWHFVGQLAEPAPVSAASSELETPVDPPPPAAPPASSDAPTVASAAASAVASATGKPAPKSDPPKPTKTAEPNETPPPKKTKEDSLDIDSDQRF